MDVTHLDELAALIDELDGANDEEVEVAVGDPYGSRLRIDRTPLGPLSIVDESTGRTLTREQLCGDAPR